MHDVLLRDHKDRLDSAGNTKALLPRVASLLRRFPSFPEVLVSCARKMEVSYWDYLFSVFGDPVEAFQQCLSTGKLRIAALYLIVLQNQAPLPVSAKVFVTSACLMSLFLHFSPRVRGACSRRRCRRATSRSVVLTNHCGVYAYQASIVG